MNVNKYTRIEAAKRRVAFEYLKAIGIFWLISRIPGLEIKQPYRKMYLRTKSRINSI